MKPFEAPFWQSVLAELSKMSDSQLDPSLSKRMMEFSQAEGKTPVEVWNFYKEMLDVCVHIGGGSSFVMMVLDLENHYTPPEGAFLRSNSTIENAPWRQA